MASFNALRVAYLSMEIALNPAMPTYSGRGPTGSLRFAATASD
ncbi:MAG TPA: hypothetical protein VE621_02675 [Bryobacteraceae bacterium]|jgi:hypothetical protein|nr:hypothetical protein [Bryobacteraceae bacterium]